MNTLVMSIITDVENTLQTARYGLEDYNREKGPRKFAGLRNLIVFGRSVTLVMQKLRSKVENFDEWYAPIQERMSSDTTMRYFVEARNAILKEGTLRTTPHVTASFKSEDIERFGPRPAGAIGIFIGDEYGGSGWTIEIAEGKTEKFYVEIPSDICKSRDFFYDVDKKFKDTIEHTDISTLCNNYIEKLTAIVDECKSEFLPIKRSNVETLRRLPPYIRVIK